MCVKNEGRESFELIQLFMEHFLFIFITKYQSKMNNFKKEEGDFFFSQKMKLLAIIGFLLGLLHYVKNEKKKYLIVTLDKEKYGRVGDDFSMDGLRRAFWFS